MFVVVGFLVGDSIFARVSSLLIPCGLVGVAHYYADKAEGSPVVWRQAGEPGTVVLRHRPYRALPMTVGLGSFGGVITLFGAQQGAWYPSFTVLCSARSC
ncbi:hypothetical protein [Nocardia rhizosphaerae]|uniref:Uncharacterized protein n=1 Tax=Nocardia rhizosphaerae TaxID=1691571 RepID=A0ABV8KYX4_9NOCA